MNLLKLFGNGIGLIFKMWKFLFCILCCMALFNLLGGNEADWYTVGQYALLIIIVIVVGVWVHYADKNK